MVSEISDSSYYAQYVAQSSSSSTDELTDEQKSTLDEIISNYDSSSMSPDTFQSMLDEIEDAGITAGDDLKDYLEEAGFEAPEAPPEMPAEESEESNSKIQELLEQLEAGEISQDDFDSTIANMQSSGESTQGNLVDEKV